MEWIVKDVNLFEIAKKIKCNNWFELGLKLGLTAIELEQIEENGPPKSVERRIFSMLRVWRDRQKTIGEQELQIFHRSLNETNNADALKLLE